MEVLWQHILPNVYAAWQEMHVLVLCLNDKQLAVCRTAW